MLTDSRSIYVIPWALPSAPTSLNAVGISSSQINLTWGGSAVGLPDVITRYYIYRNGIYLTSVNNLTLAYADVGLASATTYTYNVAAVGAHGNISPLSNTSAAGTQGATPGGLDFPRIAITANGGDQSYGKNGTPGFVSFSASGPGTAAYTAIQQLGSFDAVFPLAGSFEGWSSAGINKQDLVNAIKALGSFPNVKNTSRTPYVFLYAIMESTVNASSGQPYQTLTNLIRANNWFTYESAGGTGTILPSVNSSFVEVNYSVAWPGGAGAAAADQSITGHVYGSLSAGQGCAASAATYFSSALLTTNRLDSRFTGLPAAGAAPNADGLFLDNCFIFPNGGGNLPANGFWDGIAAQGSATIAAYPTGASSLLARGQQQFFATMQSFLASANPGSTYYSIGNFGGYANVSGNGDTHAAAASAMDNTLHGGLLEFAIGNDGPSWQSFQTFAQVLANYYYAMDYCLAPKLVAFGIQLPATDGSQTSNFKTNGVATVVTTGTTLEYQEMRLGLCLSLLDNGFAAPVVHGLDYSVVRWYDEFGDDSLTQVNVKRGYLGQPLGGRPSAPLFNLGSLGIWGRQFANGIALVNPWGNGPQTLTTSQLAGTWFFLKGTQQPSINSGLQFSSFTFADGDGLILINSGSAPAPLTITNVNPLVPQATVGSIYGKTMNATGGVPPYSWSLISASPDSGSWIAVTAGGILQGTPTTAETETITIQVTDSVPTSVQRTYSLVVNPAAALAISTSSPLSAATTGSAYSTTISATGGQPPYVWSITSNTPNTGSWSSINSSSGVLSGTPSTAETESITVKVVDNIGGTVSKTFSLTVNAAASGFLAAGHFEVGPMSLNRIFPRPDVETGLITSTAAQPRLAYYDGVQPVQFETPVSAQGGTPPHVYSIVAGPSWLNIGSSYGSAMYGVLYGTPTAAISKASPATVTVRITGQDHVSTDITWTLATSSSTADFVFVNSTGAPQTINGVTIGTGNDSTGTGSITAPFASLTPVMGTSAAQTTFPRARVYMVGNQQWPVQSGSAYAGGHGMDSTKRPVVFMTLPGANVTIDASLVQLYDATTTGFNDGYFSGSGSPAFGFASSLLTINSGPSQPPSEHTFELYNAIRMTWRNVLFTNPVSRSTDGNNCSSIMGSNSGILKSYWLYLNVGETGRVTVGGAGSVDLLTVPFSVTDIVMDFCYATGAAPFGVYIKDSNERVSVRYGTFRNTNNSLSFQFGGQTNNGRAGNCEICYSYIRGVTFFDFQAFANNDSYWSYRNTVYNDGFDYGYALGNWGPAGTGPYSSKSDVLISKTQALSTSGAPFTSSNTEVQAIWAGSPPPSNMPIDPTTGNLVNATTAWKTLYSMTANSRGKEIG